MSHQIFRTVPLLKGSFFQRLFKQLPSDNAIIEVNNLLATHDILTIGGHDIKEIELRYNLILQDEYQLNLEEFYAALWNLYIRNENRTPELLAQVNHLGEILEISSQTTKKLKLNIGSYWYQQAAALFVTKHRFTDQDRADLKRLAGLVELSKGTAESLLVTEQRAVVKTYMDQLIGKSRCSPQERNAIELKFGDFKLPESYYNEITRQLAPLEKLWKTENLPLSIVDAGIGHIQKSEICYFAAEQVKWFETRNQSYGNARLELINQGTVYITNKRLVFIGQFKNSQISFDRIFSLIRDKQKITLTKDKGKHPTLQFKKGCEFFEIILKRVMAGKTG